MKVKHIFGGHVYLISSYGVARNPIFKDSDDLEFFTKNIKKYLGEICDIHAYNHRINEFQYLIKVKERPILEAFFRKKQALQKKGKSNVAHDIYDPKAEVIPDSYLIFSQEVSNCLNSVVKRFNAKHNRRGGLFAGRYSKYLVESEEEMLDLIDRLNAMEALIFFEEDWKVEDEVVMGNKNGECSSLKYYQEGAQAVKHSLLGNFIRYIKEDLRGSFISLPPKSIKSPKFQSKFNFYLKIHGFPPPW